jgi:hypothetical protein
MAGRQRGELDSAVAKKRADRNERMVQLAEYEIGSGTDSDVQHLAADMLPKIFSHFSSARKLLQLVSAQNPEMAAAPPRTVTGMPAPQTPRSVSN